MKTKKIDIAFVITRIIIVILVGLLFWTALYAYTQNVLIAKMNIRNDFTNAVMGYEDSGLPPGVSRPKRVGVA